MHTKDLAWILGPPSSKTTRTSTARRATLNHANPKVCSTGQSEKGTAIVAKTSSTDTQGFTAMRSLRDRHDTFWGAPKDTGNYTKRGKSIIEHTPMNKFGEPKQLISTVIWLLSDYSDFVTGVLIPVDGGFDAFGGV